MLYELDRRTQHRVHRLVTAVCLVVASAWAPTLRAQATQSNQTTGTIFGIVVSTESRAALGYSTVSVPVAGRAPLTLFTNDAGTFLLRDLPAGPTTVQARHIGYLPAEVAVTVHAGRVDTVRIALTHVAVHLSEVRVRAYPPCKTPGRPKASADPALATVFGQLEQNAEQLQLLSERYPFESLMQRVDSLRRVSGDIEIQRFDTLLITSQLTWHYEPGDVVEQSSDPRNRSVLLNVPSLIHFADATFIANHCFYNGGLETVDGTPLVRVDFLAAVRIKPPDVDGAMYLDPKTFQIRRSVFHLTKVPDETPGFLSTEVTTTFQEILPSIPVISAITSVNTLDADPTRPILVNATFEDQRLIRVIFVKDKPGGTAMKPTAPTP
jgi:hypothetical protein